MTHAELAELRGELYGLKVMLVNCLGFIAALTEDPGEHLEAIQQEAIAGIAVSTNDQVKPAHLRTFRAAAAGIVLQVADGARVTATQVSLPRRLQ